MRSEQLHERKRACRAATTERSIGRKCPSAVSVPKLGQNVGQKPARRQIMSKQY